MKKCVVVYESKYGTTKKYAEWIAQDLGADLFERKAASIDALRGYDVIIYGGGLYAGGVSGLPFITKSYEKLKDKRILLFTCGLADPTVSKNVESIRTGLDKVLPEEMKQKVEIFHLRGGMDYTKLSFIHRSMMAMVQKASAKKNPETMTQEDVEMLDTYGKSVDFTDRSTIKPILDSALS